MQYLLSEEEYLTFIEATKLGIDVKSKEASLVLARKELLKVNKYTCIHDRDQRWAGYCDGCPCSPLKHDNYKAWGIICNQARSYSK